MTLDELEIGREAVITKVGGEGALRCRYLNKPIIQKTKVQVRKVAPMGDPTIRKEDAGKIEVEPEEN